MATRPTMSQGGVPNYPDSLIERQNRIEYVIGKWLELALQAEQATNDTRYAAQTAMTVTPPVEPGIIYSRTEIQSLKTTIDQLIAALQASGVID